MSSSGGGRSRRGLRFVRHGERGSEGFSLPLFWLRDGFVVVGCGGVAAVVVMQMSRELLGVFRGIT